MAAATVSLPTTYRADPWYIYEVQVSSITSDQTENIANGSPTTATGVGVSADMIQMEIITPPTILCGVTFMRVKASDVTASSPTSAVKFVATPGGDLSGMVVKLRFHYFNVKVGGIDSGATA
jgi:hypothetical protein